MSGLIASRRIRCAALGLAAGALSIVVAAAVPGGRLTPQEKRGKQIYLQGTTSSGQEMIALIGDAGSDVRASVLPCVNCHGYDGLGRPEGGVTPSVITWEALTKPYAVMQASGRSHPPYTAALLEQVIAEGIDPAGNKLLAAMPRYRMSREDFADLAAYLRRLGKDQDPGLTEASVKVGTVVPAAGPRVGVGREIAALLNAYFEDMNRQGGIYSRKVELRVIESAQTPAAQTASFKRLINEEEVFALVGGFTTGADQQIESLIESEGVPAVGLLTAFPGDSSSHNRYVFYVMPGLKEQALALVDFAVTNRHALVPRVAIVSPETRTLRELADAVEKQCKASGWDSPAKFKYAQGRFDAAQLVSALSERGVNVVFFLGPGPDESAFAKKAAELQWTPNIFLLGLLAGSEVFETPSNFKEKIFLSFPALPSDQTPAGIEEFRGFLERHKLSLRYPAPPIWAYSAARILVEGLRLSGRQLSREKLVSALEGLYEFDTGLTPPITYGPNRRIGSHGAYVVSADLEGKRFVPASGWIAVKSYAQP